MELLLSVASSTPPGAPSGAQPGPVPSLPPSPIDATSHFVDQLLLRFFPVPPSLLWALNLALSVILTVLMAWLCGAACRKLAELAARRQRRLWAELLKLAAPTLRWMVLLTGFADALEDAWPAVKGPVRWVSGTLFVVSAIVATRGAVRLLRIILDEVLRPSLAWPGAAGDRRDAPSPHGTQTVLPLVQRLMALLVWLVGLILVLDHFGQNVGSVVAALGVTSLAIGLAAQQALSNIIAGLVLAVDHPFRIGDRIKLPSGDIGEVVELGMRSTNIRLGDGSLLVVPNADLVNSRLINQSTDAAVRAEVRVSVPVTVDVERLTRELLVEGGQVEPEPLQPPKVMLLSVNDKAELAIILWLPRSTDVPTLEERLRRAALKRVQAILPPPVPAVPTATPTPPAPPPTPTSGPKS